MGIVKRLLGFDRQFLPINYGGCRQAAMSWIFNRHLTGISLVFTGICLVYYILRCRIDTGTRSFACSLELHKYLQSIYMAKHSTAAGADSVAPFEWDREMGWERKRAQERESNSGSQTTSWYAFVYSAVDWTVQLGRFKFAYYLRRISINFKCISSLYFIGYLPVESSQPMLLYLFVFLVSLFGK